MNYLKLKQKIYEAIERNPLDRSAYEEMFAVCREYEKIDFQTAHAWNHELRKSFFCHELLSLQELK